MSMKSDSVPFYWFASKFRQGLGCIVHLWIANYRIDLLIYYTDSWQEIYHDMTKFLSRAIRGVATTR